MSDAPKRPRKIDHIWHALLGSCVAAGYDFQKYKKSNPPDIDADPITLPFPPDRIKKERPDY